MIVKNFELNKISQEKYDLFLFYGENEGHKIEVINNIFNKLNDFKKIKLKIKSEPEIGYSKKS